MGSNSAYRYSYSILYRDNTYTLYVHDEQTTKPSTSLFFNFVSKYGQFCSTRIISTLPSNVRITVDEMTLDIRRTCRLVEA